MLGSKPSFLPLSGLPPAKVASEIQANLFSETTKYPSMIPTVTALGVIIVVFQLFGGLIILLRIAAPLWPWPSSRTSLSLRLQPGNRFQNLCALCAQSPCMEGDPQTWFFPNGGLPRGLSPLPSPRPSL